MGTPEIPQPRSIGERERIKIGTKVRDMLGVSKGNEPFIASATYSKGGRSAYIRIDNPEESGPRLTVATVEPIGATPTGNRMVREKSYLIFNSGAPYYRAEVVELDSGGNVVLTPRQHQIEDLLESDTSAAADALKHDMQMELAIGNIGFTIDRADELMEFLNKFGPDDQEQF